MAPPPVYGFQTKLVRPRPDLVLAVGQQGHEPGSLNSRREHSLKLGTGAGLAPRCNFSPFGNETAKNIDVFVVDIINFFGLKFTKLALAVIEPAAAARLVVTMRGTTTLGPV